MGSAIKADAHFHRAILNDDGSIFPKSGQVI